MNSMSSDKYSWKTVCAVCCGGGRWCARDYVFGRVSVHGVLMQLLATTTNPSPNKADRPGFAITHLLRLQGQILGLMVPISRKREHRSAHRCLPLKFPPLFVIFFKNSMQISLSLLCHFVSEQCFLSVLPLMSLLCSRSLITLFSLCGKCQVC